MTVSHNREDQDPIEVIAQLGAKLDQKLGKRAEMGRIAIRTLGNYSAA
jgi:hypothetical protein